MSVRRIFDCTILRIAVTVVTVTVVINAPPLSARLVHLYWFSPVERLG